MESRAIPFSRYNRPVDSTRGLAKVLAAVSKERDDGRALDRIVGETLALTNSRNTMLAVMNDELGCMELLHGAGKEWSELLPDDPITVNINDRDGIVGYVAATGRSYATGDVRKDSIYRKLIDTTVSEIAVPVCDRHGRIRAVLNAESDQKNAYTADALLICETMAQICSMVLDRMELERSERALIMVGSALDLAQSEDELLGRVIEVAREVLRFQACSIILLDTVSSEYVLRASVGRLEDRIGKIAYAAREGCTGWVCDSGKPLLLDDPQSHPSWRGMYLEFPSKEIAAYLAVPIASRGNCIGAIRAVRRVSDNEFLDNRFTEHDLRLLQAVADQVASGLENIRSTERLLRTERMAAWGELSARSSHMIGNRVFALKGDVNELGYLVKEKQPAISDIRAIQKSLDTQVARIEEILQDFRDFVTATELRKTETNLCALVRDTAAEVFPKRTSIELKLELDESVGEVSCDPKRIRRAVSELVENALNWTQGGTLVVRVGRASAKLVSQARLPKRRKFAAISVQDTGPGIPDDQKEAIFLPFQSGRVKGMGLGLSIVKGIAEAHGGGVIETGVEGKGACFAILLPAKSRPKSKGR